MVSQGQALRVLKKISTRWVVFYPKTLFTNLPHLLMCFLFSFFPFFLFSFKNDCAKRSELILKAHTMTSYTIITRNPDKNYKKPHFFILNKGLNSGKPLKSACPNCFVCIAESDEELNTLYWLAYSLWLSKSLISLLKGSVIPFITIQDYRKVLKSIFQDINPTEKQVKKLISGLQLLELNERKIQVSLKLINTAKRALIMNVISSKPKMSGKQ